MVSTFRRHVSVLLGSLACLLISIVTVIDSAFAGIGSDVSNSNYSILFGVGLAYQDAGRVATDATGNAALLGNSYYTLSLAGRYSLGGYWGISPVINYSPVGTKGSDPGEIAKLLTVDLRLYREFSIFDLHTGPGVLLDMISGSGGTATLSNGTGQTVFGLPSGNSSSRFFYWEAGLGLGISRFRADLDLLVTDTLTARRAVYPTLTVSMGFF